MCAILNITDSGECSGEAAQKRSLSAGETSIHLASPQGVLFGVVMYMYTRVHVWVNILLALDISYSY